MKIERLRELPPELAASSIHSYTQVTGEDPEEYTELLEEGEFSEKSGDWVPYVGPQEGFGWTNGDEVLYQDEPPGPIDVSQLTNEQIDELSEFLVDQGVTDAELIAEYVNDSPQVIEEDNLPGDLEELSEGMEILDSPSDMELGADVALEYSDWGGTLTARGVITEADENSVTIGTGVYRDVVDFEDIESDIVFYGNDTRDFLDDIGLNDMAVDNELVEEVDVSLGDDRRDNRRLSNAVDNVTYTDLLDAIAEVVSPDYANQLEELIDDTDSLSEIILSHEDGAKMLLAANNSDDPAVPQEDVLEWFTDTYDEGEEVSMYSEKFSGRIKVVSGNYVGDAEDSADQKYIKLDRNGRTERVYPDQLVSVKSKKYRGPSIDDFEPEPLDTEVMESFNRDQVMANLNQATDQVADHVGEEYAKKGWDALKAWDDHGYSHYKTEPIWLAVEEMYGGNVPNDIRGRNRNLDEGVVEACKAFVEIASETIKDKIEGDTIELHRGFSADIIHEYAEIDQEEKTVTIQPQALESWTWNKGVTRGHGEFSVSSEIDVDDISMFSGLFMQWNHARMKELTVSREEPYTLTEDQIEEQSLPESMAPDPIFRMVKGDHELEPIPVEESNWTHTSLADVEEQSEDSVESEDSDNQSHTSSAEEVPQSREEAMRQGWSPVVEIDTEKYYLSRAPRDLGVVTKCDEKGLFIEKGDGVKLTFGIGGIPYENDSGREQYQAFCDEVAEEGGFLIDVKTTSNPDVDNVVYPPDLPDDHDPQIEVFGLSERDVEQIHAGYDELHFDVNADVSGWVIEDETESAISCDVFEIIVPEDKRDKYDADVLAIGVDFPNHDVYVDWHLEAHGDDQLDNAHVSIYGSLDDLRQVTDGEIQMIDTIGSSVTKSLDDEKFIGFISNSDEVELPTTCRECEERERTFNTFRCPVCHPQMDPDDDDNPPLATEFERKGQAYTDDSGDTLAKSDVIQIKIGDADARVTIVDDDKSRYKGLSGAEKLESNEGMFFAYPRMEEHRLVHRDMNFDLDVAFLNRDWEVIKRSELTSTQPATQCLSWHAIELPHGWLERNNVEIGDKVRIQTRQNNLSKTKNVVDTHILKRVAFDKNWVPYVGPRGGEGWANTDTGQIHYGDKPVSVDEIDDLHELVDSVADLADPEVIAAIDDPEELVAMAEGFDEEIIEQSKELVDMRHDGGYSWEEKDKVRNKIRDTVDARKMATRRMQQLARQVDSADEIEPLIEYEEDQRQAVRKLEERSQRLNEEYYQLWDERGDDAPREMRYESTQMRDYMNEIDGNLREVSISHALAESSSADGKFEYENAEDLRQELSSIHAEKAPIIEQRQQIERIARQARHRFSDFRLQDIFDNPWEVNRELKDRLSNWESEHAGELREREEELSERSSEIQEELDRLKEEWFVNEVKGVNPTDTQEELTGITGDEDPLELEEASMRGDLDINLNEAWNEWFSEPGAGTKARLLEVLQDPRVQEIETEGLRNAGIEEGDSVQVFRGGGVNPDRGFDSWSTDMREAEKFARYGLGSISTENNMAHGLAMMASGANERDLEELADEIHVTEVPEEYILGYDSREQELIVSPQPVPRGDVDE